MNKHIVFAFLFISLSSLCFSQEGLYFKVFYKPSTKYQQVQKQVQSMELTYSGSEETMSALKENGIKNPTKTNVETTIESEQVTGKLVDEKKFPITMTFTKVTSSTGTPALPEGTVVYGSVSQDQMPVLDSIVSAGLSEDTKLKLLQFMRNMFSQITLPQKQLKIGEVLTQETPLSIPIADIVIEMTVYSTYKLIEIKNGIGYFDQTQTFTMKMQDLKYPLKAFGSGKGYLHYDIANNTIINNELETEIFANVKVEDIAIDLKSKMKYSITSVITSIKQ